MEILHKIKEKFGKLRAWYRSRKVRRARRIAGTVVDTAASGAGLALRLAVKAVVTVLLVFITTGMVLACIFAVYVKTCMTGLDLTPEELTSNLSSQVLLEDGTEIAVLHATENRIWVDYDQIPLDMEHAAVAIEDKNFYTHKGVDWWRTLGAFGNMFLSMQDTFGGSTLTQQLIKNLTGKDDVTVQRKLLEIFRALEFEKKYTKQEIITWYLNEMYLGEGSYGVGAAAREYFGKEVWELDLAECATIIGITNNPSLYDPYIGPESYARCMNRKELTLRQMYEQGYITHEQYERAVAEPLTFKRAEGEEREIEIFSYYVDSLFWDLVHDLSEERGITTRQAETLLYNGGYKIYCCMDQKIQKVVDNVYQNRGNLPGAYWNPTGQRLASGIVILEPYTGAIVALAGNTGKKTGSFTNNYATELRRPPGSSFKPVAVYAPAIDLGVVNQNTIINDSPGVRLRGTSWYPHNSGGGYSGAVTIRQGIISSLNTVAAQTLDKIGLKASWNYLTNKFGFHSLVRDEYDAASGRNVSDYVYPALALGQLSYGITCEEMAQAYSAFVNDGVMSFARTYSLVLDQDDKVILENPIHQQVAVKANTAWNIDSILQAAVQYGTGTAAYFGSTAVAGKTGTTSDDKDRYFTGFTRYYVAAVWTGYERPTKMYFYSNPSCIIWQNIMSRIHRGLKYKNFKTPTINAVKQSSSGKGGGGSGGEKATEKPQETKAPPPTNEPVTTPVPTGGTVVTPPPGGDPTTKPVDPTDIPVTDTPATEAPATEVPTQAPEKTEKPVETAKPPEKTNEPAPQPTATPTDQPAE